VEDFMSLPVIVEVAIGLAFLYLLLSLLCTTINEIIASVLDVRAKHLEASLKGLIDDEALRKLFYEDSVFATAKSAIGNILSEKSGETPEKGKYKHPAYLDAKTFATSLLTSVLQHVPEKATGPGGTPNDSAATETGAQSPNTSLDAAVGLEDLRRAINALPVSKIRTALQSHLSIGEQTVEAFHGRVADWFDNSMARLSGIYKRFSVKLSLAVGLGVAAFFNADSIAVGRILSENSALRQIVVENAEVMLPKLDPGLGRTCDVQQEPIKRLDCQTAQLREGTARLLPLPLGWTNEFKTYTLSIATWSDAGSAVIWLVLKIAGLLATAFALSLGAPFWFDIIQTFMKFRTTGPKPAENATARIGGR
jgi:hypothetical protein